MNDTPMTFGVTPTPSPPTPVWWVIDSRDLLTMLEEVAAGGHPDLVYLEHYANCARENP